MSASFSMYVPFFRCQSFPCISLRVLWFACPLSPFHSPCTPLVFISAPFMSLSVPSRFPFISPLLSCHVGFLFPPLIFLHFLACPLCSPVFSGTKTRFFQRFRKTDVNKNKVVPDFKPAKSRQGDSSLGPLFCDTGSPKTTFGDLVERHQITARYVGQPPPPPSLGGGYPLSSLKYPTRLRNVGGLILFCVASQAKISGVRESFMGSDVSDLNMVSQHCSLSYLGLRIIDPLRVQTIDSASRLNRCLVTAVFHGRDSYSGWTKSCGSWDG